MTRRARPLVLAVVACGLLACEGSRPPTKEARTPAMSVISDAPAGGATNDAAPVGGATGEVRGAVAVDGRPQAGVDVALVAGGGATTAVATTDAAGRFAIPAGAGGGWIVAKMHDPIVGGLAAPASGDVTLAMASADAVTLAIEIELPAGAAPVPWFMVGVTPTAHDGVPEPVVRALTLTGKGPARAAVYHQVRVTQPRATLRVRPGRYLLQVAHIVERSKPVKPVPPNWIGGRATLPDGQVVPAKLGYVTIDVGQDVAVKVTMVETTD